MCVCVCECVCLYIRTTGVESNQLYNMTLIHGICDPTCIGQVYKVEHYINYVKVYSHKMHKQPSAVQLAWKTCAVLAVYGKNEIKL